MKLPQQLELPELLGLITTIAPKVHIRLALTPDPASPSPNSEWVARSLVVDVYPSAWLPLWTPNEEGPLSDCPPLEEIYDYPGQALFCAGFLPTDAIAKWFGDRRGQLYGFDARAGHGNRRQEFRLPELHTMALQFHVFSGQNDGFARLPWPHFNYEYALRGPNFSNNRDQQTLYSPQQRFDNFRDARGQLIHGLTDLRSYQDRDQVMIRVVDDDGWIRSAHLKGKRLKVTVAGRKLFGAQVIVNGTGLQNRPDNKRDILRPGPVDFTLTSAPPPDLRVILANAESGDLDQVWRSQFPGPLDTSSPHFVVEEDEPEEPIVAPASDAAAEVQRGKSQKAELNRLLNQKRVAGLPPTRAKRELKVVVVSPGDVMKERQSIREVLDELNEGVAGQLGLYLTPWLWEVDSYPGFHAEGPQRQIDDQMRIEDAAIVIGIFWTRIGTRTPDGKTGTEHELLKATEAWEKQGHPHILVYFNERAYSPKGTDEMAQWSAVYALKDQLKPKGLLGTYRSSSQFPHTLRQALQRLLQDHYQPASELP